MKDNDKKMISSTASKKIKDKIKKEEKKAMDDNKPVQRKKNPKMNIVVLILIMIIAVIALLGSSYAYYSASFEPTDNLEIQAGDLNVALVDAANSVVLTEMYPQSDTDGVKNTAYTFSVKNNGTLKAKYTLYLNDVVLTDGTRLADSNVKFRLTKSTVDGEVTALDTLNATTRDGLKSRVLDTGVIDKNEEIVYSIVLWIKEEATVEIEGQEFKTKLGLKAEQDRKICKLLDGTPLAVGSKYECDPGDGVYRNFYVLKNDTNDVKLIMERNITDTVGNNEAMNLQDAMNFFKTGAGKDLGWKVDVELPNAEDIAKAVGNTEWNTSSDLFYFDSNNGVYGNNQVANATNPSNFQWLFNYTESCTAYGCNPNTSLESKYAWGYWTKDYYTVDTTSAWVVYRFGKIARLEANNLVTCGVRPVITISKLEI